MKGYSQAASEVRCEGFPSPLWLVFRLKATKKAGPGGPQAGLGFHRKFHAGMPAMPVVGGGGGRWRDGSTELARHDSSPWHSCEAAMVGAECGTTLQSFQLRGIHQQPADQEAGQGAFYSPPRTRRKTDLREKNGAHVLSRHHPLNCVVPRGPRFWLGQERWLSKQCELRKPVHCAQMGTQPLALGTTFLDFSFSV